MPGTPPTGLAHVATASFLASRAAPSAGFVLALAGGVALARTAQRLTLRTGWAASIAAMLQTMAIMGPIRAGVPLTQAISAPVMGRMEARGHGTVAQGLTAASIRITHNTIQTAFYIWVIVGLEAYAGSYSTILSFLPFVPAGVLSPTSAIVTTAVVLVIWTAIGSTVQVLVYRRGLRKWPADPEAPEVDEELPKPRAQPPNARFDPRAVLVAAIVAFALLLSSIAWPLLAGVAVWLAAAWFFARGDYAVVRPGLALTAFLAFGTLVFGLIGGIGIEETLQRTLRVTLLVLVATWLRYAAGEEGLREVFRRILHRVRRVPAVPETSAILDGLGSTDALALSGKRLVERLRGVPAEPIPVTDAVLDWVAGEAGRHPPATPEPVHTLRARSRDAVLVAFAVAAALPFAA
jgi:hypothetical protein